MIFFLKRIDYANRMPDKWQSKDTLPGPYIMNEGGRAEFLKPII
jgi:hypothetical protein